MEAALITVQKSEKSYPIRYVSIIFGNPRSAECAGYGICKMADEGTSLPTKTGAIDLKSRCYKNIATVKRIETTSGKCFLTIIFFKKDLKADTLKKYFGAPHFRMGSDLLLPETLTDFFELGPSVLSAGLHEITETTTHFIIPICIT
jgi:hypothetical protein